MNKKKLQNILLLFSLFIILVLPTAIVGFGNLSTLVNKAFGKPFQRDESTFIVGTESSANISKGNQFSVKVVTSAPKNLPLKHFAAFIEYDSINVDVRSINLQNEKDFEVIEYNNGFLIYPTSMVKPDNYEDLIPKTCFDSDSCSMNLLETPSVTFSINGILINDLTEQQRPIKISIIGASEADSVFLWNEKEILPTLKLGEYIKNEAPEFTSEPTIYANEGSRYEYEIFTRDNDNDPVILSLECPNNVFCDKKENNPEGVMLNNNSFYWDNPIPRGEPYKITVFANDGKSISTQSFMLYVYDKNTSYFSCTYTPAIAVKIIDYREITPLVIIAESSEPLVSAKATLERDGQIEKTFDYSFEEGTKKVLIDNNSTPPLEYQFKKGIYDGEVEFLSESGNTFKCKLDNPTETLTSIIKKAVAMTAKDIITPVKALVSDFNNKPNFVNDPYLPASSGGSNPSVSFVYGTAYDFTLQAQDPDGDVLSYTIVKKPSWAKVSVTQSTGTPSQIDIKFTGTPAEADAGSNLFAVTVNDGYGKFITKAWVINVDYPNNDIPRLYLTRTTQFTLPSYCPAKTNTPVTIHQGNGFMLVFDVEDRHQIMKFGLFYAKSLAATSWKTYNANISYKMRCMEVNTANIPPGDYYFKLTATDGFSPPATGEVYTNLVRILPPAPKPTVTSTPSPSPTSTSTPSPTTTATPTDTTTTTPTPSITITSTPSPTPTEEIPQPKEIVINITSPQEQQTISPEKFQFVASIKASEDATIKKENVKISFSGKDITENITFSTEDESKSITLTYKPTALIEAGVHTIKVTAKDSKEKEAEKEITFIAKNETNSESETVSFLGFELEKKWYAILIAVIILVAILVLLPIILYFASKKEDKFIPAARPTYRPNTPPSPPNLNSPTSSFAVNRPQVRQVSTNQPQQQVRPIAPQISTPVPTSASNTATSPSIPTLQTVRQSEVVQSKPTNIASAQRPTTNEPPRAPVASSPNIPTTKTATASNTPNKNSASMDKKPEAAPVVKTPIPTKSTSNQTQSEVPNNSNNQSSAMANFVKQAKGSPSVQNSKSPAQNNKNQQSSKPSTIPSSSKKN